MRFWNINFQPIRLKSNDCIYISKNHTKNIELKCMNKLGMSMIKPQLQSDKVDVNDYPVRAAVVLPFLLQYK